MKRRKFLPPEPHEPMDGSALLDREDLPYWDAEDKFDSGLLKDMETCSLYDLRAHYPELTFDRFVGPSSKRPKGHAYRVHCGRKWTVADWRKT
jgi:hypothetical protein